MAMKKMIGSMFAVTLMCVSLIAACGKITYPVSLVLDPAASNTLSINLPTSLGGGTVKSNFVGNFNTTITVDTNQLVSFFGAPATVKVSSYAAAGTAVNFGTISTGTLCTSIPASASAGGIAYLRPIALGTATILITIPTETKSLNPAISSTLGIPPVPLTLNIGATVTNLDLNGLINLMTQGTGVNIHQVLNMKIPSTIPVLGGAAVVLDITLKSTKTPIADPKLDECAGTSTVTCGDGKVSTGETCDTAIPAGQTGACPTSCTAPDACHTSTLSGSACTTQCVVAAITPCCGNGTVDSGENCDTAIAAGQPGACPTSCTAPDACHTSTLSGSACTAKCVVTTITPCCGNGIVEAGENCDKAITSGAGACPTSCTAPDACHTSTLSGSACTANCVVTTITPCCGNGIVEAGENCDKAIISGTGACPTSCNDNNVCTTDTLSGSAADCSAKCTFTPIVPCCGNGITENGETCDGNCPTSCNDNNACTTDTLTGSAALCNVTCTHTAITACVNGDGCCPTGCNRNNDTDCNCTCGNGVVETACGETCDGNCPTSCDDSNACTIDTMTGSASTCNVKCTHTAITACVNGDGCCPAGCTPCNDSDCKTSVCGDGCVSGGETCDSKIAAGQPGACPTSCDDGNVCTTDILTGSASNCNAACTHSSVTNGTACNDGNACTQTDTCQSGICTGSNPVVCTASDQCHVAGTCNPSTGVCSNPNQTNGTACNDGNACTQTDTCQSGICTGSNPVVCTASDQCHTAGTCNPSTGVCSNPNQTNGTACNDGNACTQTDTCQSGICTGSNPVVCTALDQCHTAGTCNPSTGVCSNPTKADGADCGTSCNGLQWTPKTCQLGTCTTGTGMNCNDGNACTADSCSAAAGCSNTPITACSMTSDGCCPAGCTPCNDSDCKTSVCGDGCVSGNEQCDPPVAGSCSSTCQSCVDLTGTWIARITTPGIIDAPDLLGDPLTDAAIDFVLRVVVTKSGSALNTQFDICSLSTSTPSTSAAQIDITYQPAVLATLTASGSTTTNVCPTVGGTVTFPTFTINSGWGGPPAPASNTCPVPASGTTSCSGAIDSDGDGIYGDTLPISYNGGLL